MSRIEQVALESHLTLLALNVEQLIERFQAVFAWDAPEIGRREVDEKIFAVIRSTLEKVERSAPTCA